MDRQVDAVVGDAVLREIIGPDAFRAVAGTDHVLAGVGADLAFLGAGHVEQAGAQHAEGFLAVAELGAFVGAIDHESGRLVDDLDGGFRLVDVLAAGAGGAGHGHIEVFGLEHHLGLFGFGQHGDRGGGRVDAAGGFGGRHALDAMDAGLVAEQGGGPFTFDEEDRFADPAEVGVRQGHQLVLPALAFGEAGVGAEQFGGEQGGLFAPRAGADFHQRVAGVVGVGRDDGLDQLVAGDLEEGRQAADFLVGHPAHLGVGLVGEPLGFGELLLQSRQQVVGLNRLAREPQFGAQRGGPAAIPERGRVGHQPFQFGEATAEAGKVGSEGGFGHGGRDGNRAWTAGLPPLVNGCLGSLPASPTFHPFPI